MEDASRSRRLGPKVGHRKSRLGCQKCKHRRVKCDEKRPICGSCNRLGLGCSWPGPSFRSGTTPSPAAPSSTQSQASGISDGASSPSDAPPGMSTPFGPMGSPPNPAGLQFFAAFDGTPPIDLPESRSRRLLEHKLMQNFVCNMAKPFAVNPGREWGDMFERTVPALALEHDNLLSSMMALSASHLLMKDPANPELVAARQSYLVKAVSEQRAMVDTLSVDTADPVCLTSLFLLTYSIAALRERPLDPYAPPLQWLHMGRGAGVLMWMSVETLKKAGGPASSPVLFVANSYPRFGIDESYFEESMRKDLNGLLSQHLPESGDIWDDETRDSYEKAVSFVGSIQDAINKQEPVYALCRRIQAFALVVSPRFVTFVQEQRSRALVVLAHYFATMAQVRGPWWLGQPRDGTDGREEGTAEREIRAIARVLPPEWQALMVWPLEMADTC